MVYTKMSFSDTLTKLLVQHLESMLSVPPTPVPSTTQTTSVVNFADPPATRHLLLVEAKDDINRDEIAIAKYDRVDVIYVSRETLFQVADKMKQFNIKWRSINMLFHGSADLDEESISVFGIKMSMNRNIMMSDPNVQGMINFTKAVCQYTDDSLYVYTCAVGVVNGLKELCLRLDKECRLKSGIYLSTNATGNGVDQDWKIEWGTKTGFITSGGHTNEIEHASVALFRDIQKLTFSLGGAVLNDIQKVISRPVISRPVISRPVISRPVIPSIKLAILGAASQIGQHLSLLCMSIPNVAEISCYDAAVSTNGIVFDLSSGIPTKTRVTGFPKNSSIEDCLRGTTFVVIAGSIPRTPGMTREDLYNINAEYTKSMMDGVAKYCPNAFVAIISSGNKIIQTHVPIACEVMKKAGVWKKNRICGVTTIDVCRANKSIGYHMGSSSNVSVIGGIGENCIPLFSQCGLGLSKDEINTLTLGVRDAGTDVINAKEGGSATLSVAYAGFVFINNVVTGMSGGNAEVMNAYVESDVVPGIKYFTSPCRFGKSGIDVLDFGDISDYERQMLDDVKNNISMDTINAERFMV